MNLEHYKHLLGQRVIGYRNSQVTGVSHDGKVDFEYEVTPGVVKHETRDLAEINIATVAD